MLQGRNDGINLLIVRTGKYTMSITVVPNTTYMQTEYIRGMLFKNSLIIHKDKTKEIDVQRVSLYVLETRLPFSINFLLDFTAHTRSIFKIFTSMNLRNGSFLKPFNKLAVRVLSGIKHSVSPRVFIPDKTLLLVY